MKPTNLLFILSDQHNAGVTGCYGNPVVQTPTLDALANQGTRFECAYTPSPICVPARAALATGRYVHQIGYWENATPYDGAVPGWGHRLRENGFRVDSIGKLHFRSAADDNGFDQSHDALYVVDGLGDLLSAIRDDVPFRNARPGVEAAGGGDSTYLQYDARIADQARQWLTEHQDDEQPWALFVSFVLPHPPYMAPPHLYERYLAMDLPFPAQWRPEDWPQHPAMDYMRRFFSFDEPFAEDTIHRLLAAYYGMCTYLDEQIGRVLDALQTTRMAANTRIIYSSDHGEHLGGRGIFGKFSMYEESARVPLIIAGPDVPAAKVVRTPVSLVDCHPTILEAVGCPPAEADADLPGQSLWQIAQADDTDRVVLSEYHAVGTEQASFMLRDRRYKYMHHVDKTPQLFDMQADPDELVDLAQDAAHEGLCQTYERKLRTLLDPDAVNAQAKADQAEKVRQHGGREAVIARGFFQNSPVPGEKPRFSRH
ncbi:MAG: sulfatase [Anaerolineaceae bacterium]|nr:sulfatase [Anaerolineaceae bacterium]